MVGLVLCDKLLMGPAMQWSLHMKYSSHVSTNNGVSSSRCVMFYSIVVLYIFSWIPEMGRPFVQHVRSPEDVSSTLTEKVISSHSQFCPRGTSVLIWRKIIE